MLFYQIRTTVDDRDNELSRQLKSMRCDKALADKLHERSEAVYRDSGRNHSFYPSLFCTATIFFSAIFREPTDVLAALVQYLSGTGIRVTGTAIREINCRETRLNLLHLYRNPNVEEVIQRFGLDDMQEDLPHGDQTKGSERSGNGGA